MKDIEQYLRNCGFKKKRDGYMQLHIQHPFLNKPHIIFDSGELTVWCKDTIESGIGHVCIHKCKYSPEKLEEIYRWLTGKNIKQP